ncbi:CHC2 zinc finger domain-containing protein [Prosthecobacter sp.]|uniref:CHC2 zinc finger domain-containing protein n=1 Tax=Prosthecobacter sp. TaxID=1965333 RepID=UPI002ABCC679|nr:CHC2 zinc finger domain-containing protein [Prosthecobacter sp.]MDZ4403895.1 CHC2 zinc finger domain-containing protein [Prosthecobacter sp.]
MNNDIPALKERLLIPDVWQRLGLPGQPAASCRSPFRTDKSPSFSIYDGGRRWKDFSANEGGDVIDFIATACKIDTQEATRRFLAMAGVPLAVTSSCSHSMRPASLVMPLLHRGSTTEIERVAKTRHLCPEAVSLAHCLPTLAFGDVCGFPCWILTDQARRIAEARRLDGKPFPEMDKLGERKAHTLKGSSKAWPVGAAVLRRIPQFRAIMLVEGGPDYLAALHFAFLFERWGVLPVAMLGRSAGTQMEATALSLLAGRRVRIYPHADADGGGMTSAQIWAAQLHAKGCQVDFFDFTGLNRRDGRPVNDLNDCSVLCAEQQPHLHDLLP